MNHSAGRGFFYPIFIFLVLVSPGGCETVAPPVAPGAQAGPSPVRPVTLQAGDAISIKFAYAGQFDEVQTVRPDGKIELQLIGEVAVQGKTPVELRAELSRRYARYLKHPELAVVLTKLYQRRVYVGGEVNKPGPVPMPGELTALEAVIDAGGFNLVSAQVRNVIVIRSCNGHVVGHALDFKDALAGREAQPFYLQPRDIVYVPRTHIADVDQWVSQHLWKLLPNVGIGATVF